MTTSTSSPQTCWVTVPENSDFPIQNLPYGIFSTSGSDPRVGVAIGADILDLAKCASKGLFDGELLASTATGYFKSSTLNNFMAAGRSAWTEARSSIIKILTTAGNAEKSLTVAQSDATMHLPATIGDYTDFYASREHATNLGTMLRGAENALMPNWGHMPIGYHGRASSVVVSGHDFPRPCGQVKGPADPVPKWSPCQKLDFELEMGAFVGTGNKLGHPVSVAEAKDKIFGVVLLNDWSARDVQVWEYKPLGPFNGKNFCTTISPWVVTLDALEPFKCKGPVNDLAKILPYLEQPEESAYDIKLQVSLKSKKMDSPAGIGNSNCKLMYWSFAQLLAHHTSTGCNMRPGDLLGTGTISGTERFSFGSMIEMSYLGKKPFDLPNGESRSYLLDNDQITLSGHCVSEEAGYRIGFGNCVGTVLPTVLNHPHSKSSLSS